MPGAKMVLIDNISRHQNEKAKKANDDEFIVTKLKLISAPVNLLNLQSSQSAPHLQTLLQTHDPAPQNTSKSEPTTKAINLISKVATNAHKHDSYLFPAPRNQLTDSSCNSNNLKYAYPASQIPINT